MALFLEKMEQGETSMRLTNKIALVTGAASDIGRARALRFSQEGADIIIADIDLPKGNLVVEEIKAQGQRAIAIKVDVSQYSEVEQMVSQALAEFGKIDILVNNAGVASRVLLTEMTEEHWDRVLGINLKGYFNCSLFVAREMIKQKRGKIINISSFATDSNHPGQVAYAASKGGVNSLTRAVAVDLAPYQINVNAIAPGSIETPLLRALAGEEEIKKRIARVPLGRLGKPEDIAGIALFLASEDSNYMTGRIMIVDGGELISRP